MDGRTDDGFCPCGPDRTKASRRRAGWQRGRRMSHRLIVVGDTHSHGGTMTDGCPRSRIDGRAIVREGDPAECPIHGRTRVVDARSCISYYGHVAARDGDRLACGAEMVAGLARLRHA